MLGRWRLVNGEFRREPAPRWGLLVYGVLMVFDLAVWVLVVWMVLNWLAG